LPPDKIPVRLVCAFSLPFEEENLNALLHRNDSLSYHILHGSKKIIYFFSVRCTFSASFAKG
jgi:hypothetical protein